MKHIWMIFVAMLVVSSAMATTVKISALPAISSVQAGAWLPVIDTLNSGTTWRASMPMMATYVSASIGAGNFVVSPYSGTLTVSSLVATNAGTSNVFTVSDGGYVTAVAYLGDGSNLSGVITNPAWQTITMNAGMYTGTATISTLNCKYQPVINAGSVTIATSNLTGPDNILTVVKHNNATPASLITIHNSNDTDLIDLGLTTLQKPYFNMNYYGSAQISFDGTGDNFSYIKGGLAVNTNAVQAGTAFTVNGAMGMTPASTPNAVVGNMFMDTTASHNIHVYDGSNWRVLQWL